MFKPLIQLHELTKVFHTEEVETHALSGIDLEIAEAEYVSISGPSGSIQASSTLIPWSFRKPGTCAVLSLSS